MHKFILTIATSMLGVGLASAFPPQEPGDEPPPPRKKGEPAKKGEPGPEGDLRRAYELLRRIRTDDGPAAGPDERLRDWSAKAADLYRRGVKAHESGDRRLAHEYGAAAHDLARAVDHARNAALLDRPVSELPPPPQARGPEGGDAEVRRDLRHAYDRIRELGEGGPDARSYVDAARDLYNAARRDAEGGRPERARELARAAEAMTHVPEHLGHAAEDGPEPKARPEGRRPKDGPDDELPPPLPPR